MKDKVEIDFTWQNFAYKLASYPHATILQNETLNISEQVHILEQ